MSKGLFGHVVIRGAIIAKTGLHIGASADTVEIGGIDTPVIKHPITFEPYIPGSSLKGKMRSLLEKINVCDNGMKYNRPVVKGNKPINQHICDDIIQALDCPVCRVFGSTGQGNRNDNLSNQNHPARILVRDATLLNKDFLIPDALLITEAKMENVLDRVTSHAVPRTIERVPAGAKFAFEIVYRVEGEKNADKKEVQTDVKNILLLLRAVEREGLGGNTSRGHGQVGFELTEFFYQKVKESDSTSQFSESKGLEKVIEHINKDNWELQGL
ncbi:type III-A CRISPR-associated RAMP protein Csm3 [Prosthecochloris marina]|uniref:CRISPR system Cms endoribonuclease Csm3 n=1 Tax=Prosthecochloris marina TaxID=2017681 RepID=A0A317T8E1_9CHLB|nr:type III-A CRISPR-associated RAMP protein Csm3 [Prosthecochloris marina]PWW82845.1 type III-A CRISPR-associated RAMP protein Csm3 [Prosthecochloris marina]